MIAFDVIFEHLRESLRFCQHICIFFKCVEVCSSMHLFDVRFGIMFVRRPACLSARLYGNAHIIITSGGNHRGR